MEEEVTTSQLVGFTCRTFGPCGAQVEKGREGSKNGGRQKQKYQVGFDHLPQELHAWNHIAYSYVNNF